MAIAPKELRLGEAGTTGRSVKSGKRRPRASALMQKKIEHPLAILNPRPTLPAAEESFTQRPWFWASSVLQYLGYQKIWPQKEFPISGAHSCTQTFPFSFVLIRTSFEPQLKNKRKTGSGLLILCFAGRSYRSMMRRFCFPMQASLGKH
jgi:hypothetical protein